MLKEFLETSKIYDKRITDLRIQASTLCLYNFLMTYCALYHEELNWDYSLIGSSFADRLGVQLTFPIITSKFGSVTGFLNVLFSSCMTMSIIIPTPEFRSFLLPGIFWNVYAITAHGYNIFEMTYDFITLSVQISVAFSLLLTGIFTIALHGLLLLETILFYDYLNVEPKTGCDITIWEVEDTFRDSFRTGGRSSHESDESTTTRSRSECGDGYLSVID